MLDEWWHENCLEKNNYTQILMRYLEKKSKLEIYLKPSIVSITSTTDS